MSGMDRQPVLQGPRLTLRPLRRADRAALYELARAPEVWAGHPSHDRWLEPVFDRFFEDGLERGGALAVCASGDGTLIGSSQFGIAEAEAPGEIELGWSFLGRAYWGLGHNPEIKGLMLAHALRHYERAIFQVGSENVISRKAMTKIGGVLTARTRSFERAGKIVEHVIFEITRESFEAGPLAGFARFV